MGVFDDKKFEELDWISQATEPIDSKLNDVLAKIPDKIDIDFAMYKRLAVSGWNQDITLDAIISHTASVHCGEYLGWDQRKHLLECFTMEVDGDITVDFSKRELIGGTISVIKIQTTMDEKVLQGILGQEGLQYLFSMYNISQAGLSRANEIMELLTGCDNGLKSRSERKKRESIRERLKLLFKNNEWNIRDTELANKVGKWIRNYVENGDLAAYSNFCRLKVMTHKGLPIYSMEEIV